MPEHCKTLTALPKLHRDPFDRMLIAQVRTEQLVLVTRDKAINGYGRDGAQVLSFAD